MSSPSRDKDYVINQDQHVLTIFFFKIKCFKNKEIESSK